jgi:hypothetical protein
MGWPHEVSERALLYCGRHCCVCHKFCGVKIELHHIVPKSEGGEDTFDNCIPLCFDCHADVMAYNPKHPKGRKYTTSELKAHRDRWYGELSSIREATGGQPREASSKRDSQPCLQTTDHSPDAVLGKADGDTQNRQADIPDGTVTSEGARDVDYIYQTSVEFEQELVSLNEQVDVITQERKSAEKLGLRGSAEAAEAEMRTVQERIQILERRVEIIGQGYEFWDEVGFQIACESCCFPCRWYGLGYFDEGGKFVSDADLQIRVPMQTQATLKTAIDSRLFERFLICEVLSCPTDFFDLELGDYNTIFQECIYYLFGSPCRSDQEIFYISQWSVSYF